MNVRRIFVEKKYGFDVEAKGLYNEIHDHLRISEVEKVRVVYRYDIEGISEEIYLKAKTTIFSEDRSGIK